MNDFSVDMIEYEPYLQIWIATYGDISSQGKTKEEALANLEIDIAYTEAKVPNEQSSEDRYP